MANRLLFYTHAFAPKVGGVESVVMSLATELASQSGGGGILPLDVTVVTLTPEAGFDDGSLPFAIVRQPKLAHLLRLIRASDVVHLAGACFLPLLLSVLFRKPVVVEHHGFQTICPNGQLFYEPTQAPCPGHFMAGRHHECIRCNAKNGLARSIALWVLTFPRRWLSARATANIMPTNWLGNLLKLPRSTMVYHGLSRNNFRQLPSTFAACPTFGFMGRLVSAKGVQILLQAAARLHAEGFQFRVKVIGDGPDRNSLQSQASVLGLTGIVNFLGYVSANDLEKHLFDVSTIIVPSLAGEVFGLVAAENMARGKLLIVSDTGSLSEVVAETGLAFTSGDVDGLAGCMKRALQDEALPAVLGAKAKTRAWEEFNEQQMIAQHCDIYRAAMST